MCFSAKVKTPKVDTTQMKAPEAAPLTTTAAAVQFGNDGNDVEADVGTEQDSKGSPKGSKSVTNELKAKPKSKGIRAAIRDKATG